MNQTSETLSKLAGALSAAQGEFPMVAKEAENPFFKSKYADLASITKAVQPILKKNGLAVVQTMEDVESGVMVRTTLLHSSGEYISGLLRMKPVKEDPQGMGSAITYARRYSLSAILGIATEEDDDGAAASGTVKGSTPSMREKGEQASPVDKARGIYVKFEELGWKKDAILAKFLDVTGKKDMKKVTEEDVKKLESALNMASAVKEVQKEGGEVLFEKKLSQGVQSPEDLLS